MNGYIWLFPLVLVVLTPFSVKRMAFNGFESSAIDPNIAAEWTRNYRIAHPGEQECQFFGQHILRAILDQPGCKGIRFYYGTNDSEPQLLAVGANNDENDQLGDQFIVADDTVKGPPRCGQPNILNS